ncbi:MAG: 3-oxoacyl-ACP reductase family protein [Acidimicrobiales bacterium]
MSPVAVVTGGTRSIGAAITERLLTDGSTVIAVYGHDDDQAATFVRQMALHGERLHVLRADVGDPTQCDAIVDDTMARYGRLDHLVNNAAVSRDQPVTDMTTDDWDEVIRVDLSGVFHLTQAALRPMLTSGRGRIVQVGSIAGWMGATRQSNYAAAKAGIIGFSRSVAREVSRRGITVNVVLPGPTAHTRMNDTTPIEVTDALARQIPMRRLGETAEVAHAVAFFLDDRSSYITGASLPVDGGFSMPPF